MRSPCSTPRRRCAPPQLPAFPRRGAGLLLVSVLLAGACTAGDAGPPTDGDGAALQDPQAPPAAHDAVTARLRALVAASGAEVGLYYRSLAPDGDSITLDADLRMHAASTMKVPVMLQLYLDDATGRFDLDAPVEVTTRFTSIANGSPYDIDPASDSDPELYDAVGSAVPARHLLERMIIRSSNLATNLLIRHAGAARVTTTMRRLGADSIEVLRGVEDLAAFRAGLSNTTTARDLGVVFRSLADDGVASAQARAEMIGVLERQEYRSQIPAGVPPGTRVANKTGWITGIVHDAALVLPDGEHPPYVLVVLIRGFDDDPKGGEALAAALSREVWAYHTGH